MDEIAVGGMGAGGGETGGLVVEESHDDFSSLSAQQKLSHSNWKARKEGLDEVIVDATNTKDAFFSALPKLLKESNPSCLEAFFDAIISVFGVLNDTEVSSMENEVLKLVVEKGIVGRPKAVASCEKILKGLVAMPTPSHAAAVQTRLSVAIAHKTPKNRQAAATSFASVIETFGPSKLNIKQLMKDILPLFSDQNAAVRKETQNFAVQVYRHIGPGINPFIAELRDVQQAELQKLFEAAQPIAPPGGAAAGDDAVASSSTGADGSSAGSQKSEGNYILPNPPKDGHMFMNSPDTVLRMNKELLSMALDKGTKWQDRNKAAQDLLKPLQSAYRLRTEDYTDLAKFLRDFLNDPQVPLNTTSFKSIQDLARVLREGLVPYVRHLIPAIFDKFKDKKTPVIEHVYTTLGILLSYKCCTFEQLQDEIDNAMASKIPHHRVAIITWLNLIVPLLPAATVKARLARAQHFPKLLTDEKTEVKDGTLILLGKISAVCGDGVVSSQIMNNLDAKQRVKVQQGMDAILNSDGSNVNNNSINNTNIDSPSRVASRRPTAVSSNDVASASAAASGGRSPRHDKNLSGLAVHSIQASSSSNVGIDNPLAAARSGLPGRAGAGGIPRRPTNAVMGGGGGGAPSFDYGDPGSFEGQMPSKMEAYTNVSNSLGDESGVMAGLTSKEWAKRQAAVAAIEAYARERWGPSECARVLDSLVIQFQSDPSFKESIFQVNTAVISCLLYVVRTASNITNKACFVLVQHLGPKLSDPKCKGPMKELLTALAEGVGIRFVIRYLTAMMGSLNQPRLTTEGIEWIQRALFEFSKSPVDHRVIVKYVKSHCFEGQAQPVKSAGVQLLVVLRQRVGPEVDALLNDVNPHLRATIASEVARGVPEPADAVPRVVRPSAGEEPLPEESWGMNYNSVSSPTPSSALSLGGAPSPFSTAQSPMLAAPGGGIAGSTTSPARTRSAANLSRNNAAGNQSPSSQSGARRPSTLGGGLSSASLPIGSGGNVSARGSASSVMTAATDLTMMDSAIGAEGDASHLMPPLIKEIVNGLDWKARLNAVKKVENILKPEGRTINSYVAGEMLKALRTRFDEVNKNLIVDVLRTMNVVVDAASPAECRSGMKYVLPSVLNFLGDQKQQLRDEATYFCQVAFHTLGAEHVLPYVAKPLSNEAQFARLSIVSLLESVFEQYVQAQEQSPSPPPPLGARHVQALVPPLLRLLMDRLSDVRLGAEHVLIYIIHIAGTDVLHKAVLDLKQADRQQVKMIVERCVQQVALSAPQNQHEEEFGGEGDAYNEGTNDAYDNAAAQHSNHHHHRQYPQMANNDVAVDDDYEDNDNSLAVAPPSSNLYADDPQQQQQQRYAARNAANPQSLGQQQRNFQQQQQQQQYVGGNEDDDVYLPAAAQTISGERVPRLAVGGVGGYIQQHQRQMAAMGIGGGGSSIENSTPSSVPPYQQQQPATRHFTNGGGSTAGAGISGGGGQHSMIGVPPQTMVRSPLPMPIIQSGGVAATPSPSTSIPSAVSTLTAFSPAALAATTASSLPASPAAGSASTSTSFYNNNIHSGGGILNSTQSSSSVHGTVTAMGHNGTFSGAANTTQHSDGLMSPLGLDGILSALENGRDEAALSACAEFIRRFRADPLCVDNDIISAMCNRLRRTISSRSSYDLNVFIQQGMETPPPPRTMPVNTPLAASLIECLTAIFNSPSSLTDLEVLTLTSVFNVIIDSIMSDPPDSLVRGLNNFALGVVMRSPADVAYRAMILCLADYTLPYLNVSNQTNHKYMTLILKCLMRLDVTRLSPSVLISASHDYLEVHPPSQFRTKDDLAIRTIKTKIQTMCGLHGHGLLHLAEEEGGPSSVVVHLVRAALEASRSTAATPTTAPTPLSVSQQQAPPPQSHHMDPNAAVGGAGYSRTPAGMVAGGRMSPSVGVAGGVGVGGQRPLSPSRQVGQARVNATGTPFSQVPSSHSQSQRNLGGAGVTSVNANNRTTSPQSASAQARPRAASFVGGVTGTVSPHRGVGASATSGGVVASRRSTSPYLNTTASAARNVSPGAVSGFRQQQGGGVSPSRLQQGPALGRGASFSHHPTGAYASSSSAGPSSSSSSHLSAAERTAISGHLAEIFSMARKPEETAQGLQKMYDFIKSGAAEDSVIRQRFEKHFAECSEPFRNYLGKRLNAARMNDGTDGVNIKMPTVITETLVAQGLVKP